MVTAIFSAHNENNVLLQVLTPNTVTLHLRVADYGGLDMMNTQMMQMHQVMNDEGD